MHLSVSVRILYSVRMQENAGKMRTEITLNTDPFYAVLVIFRISVAACKIMRFCLRNKS